MILKDEVDEEVDAIISNVINHLRNIETNTATGGGKQLP